MGWRTVVDVRDFSRATGAAYTVAIVLAERAPDESRVAKPGIRRLAIDAHCDRGTAQRALKTLEGLGEIRRLSGESGRGHIASFYVAVGAELYDGIPYEQTRPDWEGPQDDTLSEKGPQPAAEGPQDAAHNAEKGPHVAARTEPTTNVSGEPSKGNRSHSPDVERLCALLEAQVNAAAETPGRKRVGEVWRTDVDRLLRLDGRTPKQVEYVIGWLGRDGERSRFWAINVQSGKKLRARFDQLVAEIKAEDARKNGRGKSVGPTGDDLRARAKQLRSEGR